ncbi:hypothetical protein OG530_19175 [Streptomyces decoyicus]|uniref:hypothetical protein n=1 Tax=Streptomyces decoyicus TaxID=249567 RepID=UPI002E184163
MNTMPWRDRVQQEDALVEQLQALATESAARRADALAEGVAELGSVYAVAAETGKSWSAVDKAIKKQAQKKKGRPKGRATTE